MHLPPPAGEIWRDIEAAAHMWEELPARGCELDFELDAQGAAVITLRDLDGRFLRSVTPTEAVEIASTKPGPALDRLLRSWERRHCRSVRPPMRPLTVRRCSALMAAATSRRRGLTARERQVLTLLARGHSGEEVARELEVSGETVRAHVRNSVTKLRARTRLHAVVLALQRGEITS